MWFCFVLFCFISCVTFDKSLNLSGIQFPYLENGNESTFATGNLWKSSKPKRHIAWHLEGPPSFSHGSVIYFTFQSIVFSAFHPWPTDFSPQCSFLSSIFPLLIFLFLLPPLFSPHWFSSTWGFINRPGHGEMEKCTQRALYKGRAQEGKWGSEDQTEGFWEENFLTMRSTQLNKVHGAESAMKGMEVRPSCQKNLEVREVKEVKVPNVAPPALQAWR